jgi:hypothetical protein
VTVQEDETRTAIAKTFVAVSGTLTLGAGSLATWEFAGTLAKVTLVESSLDPKTSASTPVPGGACLLLDAADFTTVKAVGADCSVQQDCGDMSQQICDPATKKCAASQCAPGDPSQPPSCGAGGTGICLSQVGLSVSVDPLKTGGVCYQPCMPFGNDAGTGCPAGLECVIPPTSMSQIAGICMPPGTTADGAACDAFLTELDTGCVAGELCAADGAGYTCRKHCDSLASVPDCPVGFSCKYAAHACLP